jgi:hypothetical protein
MWYISFIDEKSVICPFLPFLITNALLLHFFCTSFALLLHFFCTSFALHRTSLYFTMKGREYTLLKISLGIFVCDFSVSKGIENTIVSSLKAKSESFINNNSFREISCAGYPKLCETLGLVKLFLLCNLKRMKIKRKHSIYDILDI